MNTPIATLLRAQIVEAGWDTAPPEDPVSPDAYVALLTFLYETGRRDLPLGRLLEGHVDAVQIVRRYGSPDQCGRLLERLRAGALLGVWNAGLAGEPLRLDEKRLYGGKSYASGAGVLTDALVTVDSPDGPQLLLLDLAKAEPAIDREWWHTIGMQRSETHLVGWDGAEVADDWVVGTAGDYAREPYFSGGALRFVAVHAGGVAALFDHARAHLVATARAADPFQSARLASLYSLADQAAGAVRRAAEGWFGGSDEARIARVAAARIAVASAAAEAMAIAQEAVGLQGLFHAHPLSATLADLAVYLRQPAPDAQRLRVGAAAACGVLSPRL